jgi:hypothetical protein
VGGQRQIDDQVHGAPVQGIPGIEDPARRADVHECRFEALRPRYGEWMHPLEDPTEVLRVDAGTAVTRWRARRGHRPARGQAADRADCDSAGTDLAKKTSSAETEPRLPVAISTHRDPPSSRRYSRLIDIPQPIARPAPRQFRSTGATNDAATSAAEINFVLVENFIASPLAGPGCGPLAYETTRHLSGGKGGVNALARLQHDGYPDALRLLEHVADNNNGDIS